MHLHQSIHREPLVPPIVHRNLEWHLLQDFHPWKGFSQVALGEGRYADQIFVGHWGSGDGHWAMNVKNRSVRHDEFEWVGNNGQNGQRVQVGSVSWPNRS